MGVGEPKDPNTILLCASAILARAIQSAFCGEVDTIYGFDSEHAADTVDQREVASLAIRS